MSEELDNLFESIAKEAIKEICERHRRELNEQFYNLAITALFRKFNLRTFKFNIEEEIPHISDDAAISIKRNDNIIEVSLINKKEGMH